VEGIEPLRRLGSAAVWAKYRAPVIKTGVLLAVDVLEVAVNGLVLALRVFRALTGRGPWQPDAALQARVQRDLVLLTCAWPVAVVWWLRWHQHDLECARVFRAYNTVMAMLFSASAAWLAFSVLRPDAPNASSHASSNASSAQNTNTQSRQGMPPDPLRPGKQNARFSVGAKTSSANAKHPHNFLHRDTACCIGTQQARMAKTKMN
jgi:hypothetical protein